MSENNHDAKSSARDRLRAEREKQQNRERRGRQMKVAGAVLVVLAAAAGIAVAVSAGGDDDKSDTSNAVPKGARGGEKPAVTVGAADAPSTLTVWEDFRCPACARFETSFRDTIHELEDSGQLKSEYHIATIIDGNMGGTGSLKSGNAAACSQDAGKFRDYHDTLYANQPEETDDTFSGNAHLIDLAGKVNGLVSDDFTQCVKDGRYEGWVKKSNSAFGDSGYRGTPTILLNGKNLLEDPSAQLTPAKFQQMVEDANKGKKAGTTGAPAS